jgi:hypothetical protein
MGLGGTRCVILNSSELDSRRAKLRSALGEIGARGADLRVFHELFFVFYELKGRDSSLSDLQEGGFVPKSLMQKEKPVKAGISLPGVKDAFHELKDYKRRSREKRTPIGEDGTLGLEK